MSSITATEFVGVGMSLELKFKARPCSSFTPEISRITFQDDPAEVSRLRDYALPLHQSKIRAPKLKKSLIAWVSKAVPRIAPAVIRVSNTRAVDKVLRTISKLVNKE